MVARIEFHNGFEGATLVDNRIVESIVSIRVT